MEIKTVNPRGKFILETIYTIKITQFYVFFYFKHIRRYSFSLNMTQG